MAGKPPPGPPTTATVPPPPAVPKPRIPLELADAPTQRLYLFAAFLLLQALKVADVVAPAVPNSAGASSASASLLLELLNSSRLLKWIAIDLFAMQVVSWLRVPRFDWGWKALWLGRIAIVLLDWLCFGSWTVRSSPFPKSSEAVVTLKEHRKEDPMGYSVVELAQRIVCCIPSNR